MEPIPDSEWYELHMGLESSSGPITHDEDSLVLAAINELTLHKLGKKGVYL
jgi:hypothetical protein